MFSNILVKLPLTDSLDAELFPNIYADSYMEDDSFCATLRALLYTKLPIEESTHVTVETHMSATLEGSPNPSRIDKHFVTHGLTGCTTNLLHINVVKGFSFDDFQLMKKKVNLFSKSMIYCEDISAYLSQNGELMAVYVCTQTKKSLVLAMNLSVKGWHFMQSAITKLLPWNFTKPLEGFERRLLESLTLKSYRTYITLISAFSETHSLREKTLSKKLLNFGISFEKKRLHLLEEEQKSVICEFNHLQEQVSSTLCKKREIELNILGVQEAISKGDTVGLADYFVCNNSIHLCSVYGEHLRYVVTTYLDYFDQGIFEKCYENASSYFYTNESEFFSNTNFKLLLKSLFGSDLHIKIRTCAEFDLSLSGTLTAARHSSEVAGFETWLPHPHINDASCLGTNARYINELMSSRNYVGAIEQSIAATKNINFADSFIAKKLIYTLRMSKQQFLELPNRRVVSPKECMLWLNEGG